MGHKISTKESGSDPRGALPGGVSLGLDSSSGRDWWMGRATKGGDHRLRYLSLGFSQPVSIHSQAVLAGMSAWG